MAGPDPALGLVTAQTLAPTPSGCTFFLKTLGPQDMDIRTLWVHLRSRETRETKKWQGGGRQVRLGWWGTDCY